MKGDPPLRERSIVDKAIPIAVIAHQGQKDKAGEAYIHHPLRVLELVRRCGGNLVTQAAAVLHDVKEDGEPMWREPGFLLGALGGADEDFRDQVDRMFVEHGREAPSRIPRAVVAMVDLLTHPPGEAYRTYVRRLANDRDCALAKWADSTDNWARLHNINDEAKRIRLHTKYEQNFHDLGETPEQKLIRAAHRDALRLSK